MEELLVFEARGAIDPVLARLSQRFRSRGYEVEPAETFDLELKEGTTRAFVGLAGHPEGLAARVKCKALLPGKSRELLDAVRRELVEALGEPVDRSHELEAPR